MSRTLLQFRVFITNSLLEALRNKTLYAVLAAALLTMGAASTFGALSLHQDERIFNNLVFFANMLFLVALSIYQGVTSLQREIEHKTIFTVLSKPVTRGSFLVGKYVASAAIIAVCALLMFGLKAGAALLMGYDLTATHAAAYFAAYLQLAIVVALAFFFASFSTPLLSALFTFCLFLIGSLTPQIEEAARSFAADGNPVYLLLDSILYVIPDLEKLNLSYELTHQIAVPGSYLFNAVIYTATVITFLLGAAYLLFRRRDFA